MAAIITDDFRRNSATFLINDIIDKNAGSTDDSPEQDAGGFEYFVGIGKSDPWENDVNGNAEDAQGFATPLPNGSVSESNEVLDNLVGAVAVPTTNAFHVIPRINYSAGRKYKRWDLTDPTMFDVSQVGGETIYPCYAVHNDKLYICLDNDANDSYGTGVSGTYQPASTSVDPSGSSSAKKPVNSSTDGYTWVYVQDVDPTGEFNTDQFIQVNNTQSNTFSNDQGGVIYGFKIESQGSSLTNAGTAGDFQLVISDSTLKDPKILDCTATITNGAVTGFVCPDLDTVTKYVDTHRGVERASVRATSTVGGTLPKITPLISPKLGFGYQPTKVLPAFYAGLAVDFNDDVGGELPTSVKFRQISLIRGITRNAADDSPEPSGSGTYSLQEVLSTLRRFKVTVDTDLAKIKVGDIITESTVDGTYDNSADVADGQSDYTKAKAFVDYVDVTNKFIYFHQNESANINHNDFTTGNGSSTKISVAAQGHTAYTTSEYTYESTSFVTPEYTPRTGEVVFLENRKPIQRAESQEEEIKLVIQF